MEAAAGTKRKSPVQQSESPRALLKLQAYTELKRRIQDAVFEPGAFLSERQLALLLGMSKTPVKAALERLEAEGFISVSPQQGIVVRDLSVHEIADQFEIRLALESFVLRNVAGKLDKASEARVRTNLRRQELAARQSDLPTMIELDAQFHGIFCECLGNQEIVRLMTQLRDRIHRAIGRVFRRHEDRIESSWKEHAAIAEAVLKGDPDQAVKRLEQHLDFGKQLLLSSRR